jgi:hypothetical protein
MAPNVGHDVKKGNISVEQNVITSANNSQTPSTKVRKEASQHYLPPKSSQE